MVFLQVKIARTVEVTKRKIEFYTDQYDNAIAEDKVRLQINTGRFRNKTVIAVSGNEKNMLYFKHGMSSVF